MLPDLALFQEKSSLPAARMWDEFSGEILYSWIVAFFGLISSISLSFRQISTAGGCPCRSRPSAQHLVQGDEITLTSQTEVDQALLGDVLRTLSDEDA